jgi:alpha-1,3-fucosyltransferase 10
VYLGAPHIEDYAPDGLESFINARDFNSPEELVEFLRVVAEEPAAYDAYFGWKDMYGGRLPGRFSEHLHNCAHYAECRLCELVHMHT